MKFWLPALCILIGTVNAEERPGESHSLTSEFQNGDQGIRVLVPADYQPDGRKLHRTLYILPVEPGFEHRFGEGLETFARLDAHNRFDLILVQPGFEKIPWFGDHATDPQIRQSSYLRDFVVPFIEKHYRASTKPEDRLLIGFSKSGWGAFSLILRDPDFWGYAAAWDSPMFFEHLAIGTDQVFGTLDQMKRYRPDLLIRDKEKIAPFRRKSRLVLTGEKAWGGNPRHPAPGGGSHTVEFHEHLEAAGVLHHYDPTLTVPHRWDSGWAAPTLKALMKLVEAGSGD